MKCPYCGSKNTQCTNIGTRAFARIASLGVGCVATIAGPAVGKAAMYSTNKAICEYREYICLDCKETFKERRAW